MKNYYSNIPTVYIKYDTDVTTVEIIYSTTVCSFNTKVCNKSVQ